MRLSGPDAVAIATPMLRLTNPLAHAQARFAEILDSDSASRIDEAIVTFFAAPNSYTGEDIVEIAAHGSPVVLDLLMRQAIQRGARLAEPGEFTQRAFLSGRIDLIQAEAVRDLIEAQTVYQARVAASQLGGALSRRVQPAKDALIALIATLEAGIDFAEDDIDVMPNAEILDCIEAICAPTRASRVVICARQDYPQRAYACDRRPAQCRQVVALQPPCGARESHRDGHSGNDA